MADTVQTHYSGDGELSRVIAERLQAAGKDLARLSTADLVAVDEFHIRGRKATLELAGLLNINASSRVLDIGSGLGGPARTIAETFGCHVTGIDLTPEFCDAATAMSRWVGLSDRVEFIQGDATRLPFADAVFDAALSMHVAMNIEAKDRMFSEARRVLKRGGRFVSYDVLQGEGGDVLYPVPWARDPSISHLASPQTMPQLLSDAGFRIVKTEDSTEESQLWFEEMAKRMAGAGPAVTFEAFLGKDFAAMAKNQVANLRERRIRTVSYICEA